MDNLSKAPCPQIIRTSTTKDRVDNLDTHFQGLSQEKNQHIKKNDDGFLRSEKKVIPFIVPAKVSTLSILLYIIIFIIVLSGQLGLFTLSTLSTSLHTVV